jgi:hypothetical protein
MFTRLFTDSLLQGPAQPVMGQLFAPYSQLDFVARIDTIAAAVIGIIVVCAAVFALMCRYK